MRKSSFYEGSLSLYVRVDTFNSRMIIYQSDCTVNTMHQVLFTVFLTVFIFFLSCWYKKRRKYVRCMEKFPGPPPLPIIGNALDIASPKVILRKLLEYHEKYGGLVKIYVGPTPNMLIINDYKFLEFVLGSTQILDKAPEYAFFSKWFGSGLSLATGDLWRKHRKILTPAFHFQVLEQFIEIFEANANILVSRLKKELEKSSTDIYPFVNLCALDIICETAMGTSVNAQTDADSQYVRSVKGMCRLIADRFFNPILQHTFPYVLTKHYRMEKKYLKALLGYTTSVISERKQELMNQHIVEKHSQMGTKKRLAFLDLLLQGRETNMLSDKEIQDEVNMFMFAGHDTTASVISFVLFSLAQNLEIQNRAIDELREIFTEDKSRPVTLKDLQKMNYLEAVIKETLRLYPAVPFFGRHLQKDVIYGDTTLPKGLVLCIFAYGIHRNPEIFPEPYKFLPERFLYENVSGKFPYGYIPFSAGPRNCIGKRFAMLEMKVVLSIILRHYELLPAVPKHNLDITAEIVIASTNGICIRLIKRNF